MLAYDSKQKHLIHQLLDSAFNDEELINFCAQYFRDVFNRFTTDTGKATKIQMLIEDCAQRGRLARLIAAIRKEKPAEYEAFAQQVQASPPKSASTTAATSLASASEKPARQDVAPLARAQRTKSQIIVNPERLIDHSLEGRYRINEILDKGGIGAVFKAYDTKLRLDVAVKIIDLSMVKQPAMKERVRREVQTAKKLDHPGVVRVYDFGQTDSLLYIIMEYIPGYNLEEARRQFKGLTSKTLLPQILQMVRQICLTVDYMHQQGILHPGTKPENIMLKPGQSDDEDIPWRPVLINLGLLRPHREALMAGQKISIRRLTYTVSPELLLGHATDIRSDVYTLGIVLYDLLVGQPPFTPQSLEEALQMHVEALPPEPRSINPDIPVDVQKVMLKALAKDPSDRFFSAKDMAQALAACLTKPALPALPDNIAITLPDSQLVVTPGESLVTTFSLYNEGKQPTHCHIKVHGIPAEWVSLSPSATTLAPDQEQVVSLSIEPPRAPQSRAKHYALTIQVIGQRDRKPIDEVKSILKVAPYKAFESSLWPQEISPEQITQITIENLGNAMETFTIRPKPEKGLTFQPEQEQLRLAPGDQDKVDFRVIPRFRLIGEQIMQTFSFEVSVPEGDSSTLSGEITSSGVMSTRLFAALLTIIGLIICVVFSFYNIVSDMLPANATVQAAQSQAAAVAAGTTQAIRIEATASRAATETANWLGLDSDGDDLINREELRLKTTPDNPDSDGDGLPDGKEVYDFGTDPRFADSDFDGVPDNEEVRVISNPASRDTDNDGTPDSLDADLRQLPTATFTPMPTATQGPVIIRFGQPTRVFNTVPRYQARENQGSVIIDVVLAEPASQSITVDYELLDDQYRNERGTLRFMPGQTQQTFEVNIIDDDIDSGNKIILMALRNPSPGADIETPLAELVIIDND